MKPADVPAGPLLVDTDVVSYWVLKADQAAAFTELVAGRPQAISFATYGELLAVGHKATWGERRLNEPARAPEDVRRAPLSGQRRRAVGTDAREARRTPAQRWQRMTCGRPPAP
jgi:predicted nucleic acid-binding protein